MAESQNYPDELWRYLKTGGHYLFKRLWRWLDFPLTWLLCRVVTQVSSPVTIQEFHAIIFVGLKKCTGHFDLFLVLTWLTLHNPWYTLTSPSKCKYRSCWHQGSSRRVFEPSPSALSALLLPLSQSFRLKPLQNTNHHERLYTVFELCNICAFVWTFQKLIKVEESDHYTIV